MAVPFLPSVIDSIIRCSVSSCFDFFEVKFFGGGLKTFAAKVFPSPLPPWQALQCLKKISRPISKFTVSAKTGGTHNNKNPAINPEKYIETRNLLKSLCSPPPFHRGEKYSNYFYKLKIKSNRITKKT